MKTKWIAALALAMMALGLFGTVALAQGPMGGPGYGPWGGTMRGMMGGWMRGYGNGIAPGQAITPTVPFGGGPGGMMGGWMMGRGGMGPGMMGGWGYNGAPAQTTSLDQAVTLAQNYVRQFGNADLQLVEVEEYTQNFYGMVREKSTGVNAFQLIVDKQTGAVYPEMGPNMMWNTKYSPMSWMMGNWGPARATGAMTISVDQARARASEFLKSYLPNATLAADTDTFYGYYNLDVLQDGKTYGMLSVNGYSGQVWFHTWHGAFVSSKELQ